MKIKLITVGGTIASVPDPRTGELVSGKLTGRQLLGLCDFDQTDISIDIISFRNIPSSHMTIKDMLELSQSIQSLADSHEWDGVVVTHGTDTLEETAYFLDLTLATPMPVVLTGSQRSYRDMGYDGGENLRDAILTVACQDSKNQGILVVFNQQIFSARSVTKFNSTNIQGFDAPGTGPMGVTYGGKVKYLSHRYPYQFSHETITIKERITSVDLFKMVAEFNPDLIRYSIENGSKGLVIEGFGLGAVPPEVEDAIAEAARKGIPIVLTTRCATGGARAVYGGKGGGKRLADMGVIFEENINGPKARLKLIIALSSGKNSTEIRKYFEEG